MTDEAYGLIEDVNPIEIQDQIERNNLVEWCGAWKAAMRNAIGQERKTGKWITDKKSVYAGAFLERECHCSECELRRNFIGFQFDDYCSHCGAKMEIDDADSN